MPAERFERERACVLTEWAVDKATSVMKQAKEEILFTARKETPPPAEIARFDMTDHYIRHYLTKHFNPEAYTTCRASNEDTLFALQGFAKGGRPDAHISREEVKTILLKHAKAAPRLCD